MPRRRFLRAPRHDRLADSLPSRGGHRPVGCSARQPASAIRTARGRPIACSGPSVGGRIRARRRSGMRAGGQRARPEPRADGHTVAVIDKNADAFRKRLPEDFTGQKVVGFGFDRDHLIEAGIERAGAVAAVTSGDNSNILTARIARENFAIDRVVARIYDPRRALIYQRLGIPTVATVSWTTDQVMRRLLPDRGAAARVARPERQGVPARLPDPGQVGGQEARAAERARRVLARRDHPPRRRAGRARRARSARTATSCTSPPTSPRSTRCASGSSTERSTTDAGRHRRRGERRALHRQRPARRRPRRAAHRAEPRGREARRRRPTTASTGTSPTAARSTRCAPPGSTPATWSSPRPATTRTTWSSRCWPSRSSRCRA